MMSAPKYWGMWIALVSTLLISGTAQAGRVTKTNGKKILIDLEGDSAQEGEMFFVVDSNGKKKGLVKITKIKDGKALGTLGKGVAESGWTTASAKKSGKSSTSSTTSSAIVPATPGTIYYGLLGGLSMNAMTVKVDNDLNNTNETSVSLAGNAFSFKGLFDYNLFSQVWFRGLGGIEGLSAVGSTQTGCQSKACSANIYYLSGDFWARLLLMQDGAFRPWIGGAFSLMFPLSKTATALDEKSITNTSSISFGGGFDWFLSGKLAIPVQVEYSLLPKSETVEATIIAIRSGLLFQF